MKHLYQIYLVYTREHKHIFFTYASNCAV